MNAIKTKIYNFNFYESDLYSLGTLVIYLLALHATELYNHSSHYNTLHVISSIKMGQCCFKKYCHPVQLEQWMPQNWPDYRENCKPVIRAEWSWKLSSPEHHHFELTSGLPQAHMQLCMIHEWKHTLTQKHYCTNSTVKHMNKYKKAIFNCTNRERKEEIENIF